MTQEPAPIKDNRSLALLQAGRDHQVVVYDVEAGLSRHRHLIGLGVPLPKWAEASPTASVTTGFSLGKIVSLSILPVVAAGTVLTLTNISGNKPAQDKIQVVSEAPSAVSVEVPKEKGAVLVAPVEPVTLEKGAPSPALQTAQPRLLPKVSERSAPRKVRGLDPSPAETQAVTDDNDKADPSPNENQAVALAPLPQTTDAVQQPPVSEPKAPEADLQFEREIREVAAAERMLRVNPERALALASNGEAAFRKGYFSEERRYIIVLALVRLGKLTEAREKATRFFNDYPNSHFTPRIKKALSDAH